MGAASPLPQSSIIHVDMDAFYVSVELLRRPELRGRPVVVGGSGPRGVVAAASYEARSFGVHSAMASSQARRLCPHAVFLPGDHAHYHDVSRRVMQIFTAVTPLVEPLSLDEAFLDVAGARRLLGSASDIARGIRAEVRRREGLRCSVGVAPNKFLAKLASEAAKPAATRAGPVEGAGVVVIDPAEVQEFLDPLPARALWGVGPSTLARLERLGVSTVADLAGIPEATLIQSLGDAHGRHLARLCRGVDDRPVTPNQAPKSISHEETYVHDLHDADRLTTEVVKMVDAVGARLRAADRSARTITLKVRFSDFRTITRSTTLATATDTTADLRHAATTLAEAVDPTPGVRLVGVGVSGLVEQRARQLTFDSLLGSTGSGGPARTASAGSKGSAARTAAPAPWHEAEGAVDAIRARFGPEAIGPASTLGPGGLRPKRRGDQQWGPDQNDAN